jgi:hypothetical protein
MVSAPGTVSGDQDVVFSRARVGQVVAVVDGLANLDAPLLPTTPEE